MFATLPPALHNEDVLDVYSIDHALAGTFCSLNYDLISPLSHYSHADDLSLTELCMFHTFCCSGILAAITKNIHMYTRVHVIIGYITFERQCNSFPRKQRQTTPPCPTLQGIFRQLHATVPQPEKANPLVNQEGSELRPPVNALSCQCIHELH